MRVGTHLSEAEIHLENLWVEEAKADIKRFSRLYDRYFDAIFNFIHRRTDDEQEAADLTSITFFKAMQNLKKYEFRGLPFSAWLFRIATNEVNKLFRKKGKILVFSVEEDRLKDLIEVNNEFDIQEERFEKVINALRDASTETIEVLELRFFEGRSFKEIAFILDISESGAKMRTYRAIDKIRSMISDS